MNIGIIGLGLMGGSLGKTLVKTGEHKVYGYDVNDTTLLKADLVKAINCTLTEQNAGELDMLIVSVTPSQFVSAVSKFLPLLKENAIICDFCGIKRYVIKRMQNLATQYPHLIFIGGHPMAGREFSGIDKSVSTLFDKASMILVNVNADIFALDKVKHFFASLGFGEVVITDAEYHDQVIAYTSQLCHIVSNAYIKNKIAEQHFGFSAGSYKDLTRVARLNPTMWAELMMENKDNLCGQLTELIANLQKYETALKNQDKQALYDLLKEGNDCKLKIDEKNKK